MLDFLIPVCMERAIEIATHRQKVAISLTHIKGCPNAVGEVPTAKLYPFSI
jgi:hypothetical protein